MKATEQNFTDGKLSLAFQQAREGYDRTASMGTWHTAFLVELAKVELYRGEQKDALRLLAMPLPAGLSPSVLMKHRALLVSSLAQNGRIDEAEHLFESSEASLGTDSSPELEAAGGVIKWSQQDYGGAFDRWRRGFDAAVRAHDEYMQMRLLLNMGTAEMQLEHFDAALADYRSSLDYSRRLGFKIAEEKLTGNMGHAYLRLGDFDRAEENFEQAQTEASESGAPSDALLWSTNEGLAKFRKGDLDGAEVTYQRCLKQAGDLRDEQQVANAHLELGALLLDKNPGAARSHLLSAARIYGERRSEEDVLRTRLLRASLEARQGDASAALPELLALDHEPNVPPSLRWQTQQAVASLYVRTGRHEVADVWFRKAVTTFQQQQQTVREVESTLPFYENAAKLYRDFIEHLIVQGKTDDALTILDQSRARTLLSGAEPVHTERNSGGVNRSAQSFARHVHGTILVYYVLPEVSYLWAVSENRTGFYRLPGQQVIKGLVESHEHVIEHGDDPLQEDEAGQKLYDVLIRPAAAQIRPGSSVYVLADRELDRLNFDTLLTPGDHPHFWIEDVTITNATSLRLLTTTLPPAPSPKAGRLLLVGDPDYPKEAELRQAPEEVARVAGHFAAERATVLTGNAATSAAYEHLDLDPFAYVHFVAHAEPNEMNPLQSFIWLSGTSASGTPDRLYARDILKHPLRADLVTLSTCYSSGTRVFTGEGLVGLAWAFEKAGARNVIGALWEVSDSSTPIIMDHMYANLALGMPASRALREAKLTALHTPGALRKPFYWAPFQLYSNSAE